MKDQNERWIFALDTTFQVGVDSLPLVIGGILDAHSHSFLPTFSAFVNRQDSKTFEAIFDYLKSVGVPAPSLSMSDGDLAARDALAKVWPELKMAMCWYHTKKASKRKLGKQRIIITFSHFFSPLIAKIKDRYPVLFDQILSDLEELRNKACDESMFHLLWALLEKKYSTRDDYPDALSRRLLVDEFLFGYFKPTWVLDQRRSGWYQGFAPQCPVTNNAVER